MNRKNLKILGFVAAQLALVLCVVLALFQIVYCAYWLLWFLIQLLLSPLNADAEFLLQVADALPDSLRFLTGLSHELLRGTAEEAARAALLRFGILLAISAAVLVLARWLLRKLECAFKRRYMPEALGEAFADVRCDPKKRRSYDEPLCEIGLLHYIERYYSANRMEGLYRGCWVAAEEIVCGGVYRNNYSSYRVKVRGQWMTIRLDRDFDATVILKYRHTKNRLTRQPLAGRMVEMAYDYAPFAEQFVCYTDDPEQAGALLDRELVDKLLGLLERYPDLCVIFRDGCVHFLLRRRSFDRRWEYLIPFCIPHLRRVANRLYGPLQDITDELLD